MISSSSYEDELIWAGVWVYKASGDPGYLVDAEYKWDEFGFDNKYMGFGWDDKSSGMAVGTISQFENSISHS